MKIILKAKRLRKNILLLTLIMFFFSCNSNSKREKITNLLKEKIGNQLPFKEVKIGAVENGTGIIIDGSCCYWVDTKDKIYCVNGVSKTIYNLNNPKCEDAPIKATFSDIEKIVK